MKYILGQKKKMSQIFRDDGTVVPVTVIKAEPNVVTDVRSKDKNDYTAVQIGVGTRRASRLNKPQRENWKELGTFRRVREVRLDDTTGLARGQKIDVSQFQLGDIVQVTGTSKGRGYAGVVKRHHFRGGPASHGHKDNLRAPGSIGATFPQHVMKGTRMAGRLGNAKTTVKNLEVVKINAEANEIWLKGAVPGAFNGFVTIIAL